jgi:hypothetical protein
MEADAAGVVPLAPVSEAPLVIVPVVPAPVSLKGRYYKRRRDGSDGNCVCCDEFDNLHCQGCGDPVCYDCADKDGIVYGKRPKCATDPLWLCAACFKAASRPLIAAVANSEDQSVWNTVLDSLRSLE